MKIYITALVAFFPLFIFCQSKIATQDAKADLEYLIATIDSVHYNPYFKTSKKDFAEYKKGLTEDWKTDSLYLKEFTRVGMKLTALLSGGHTAMSWSTDPLVIEVKDYLFLPLIGNLVASGDYVVERSGIQEIDPKDTLISINGLPVRELFEECMSYTGGIPSFQKSITSGKFPLYLFFNDQIKSPYTIKLEGRNKEIKYPGMEVSEYVKFSQRDEVKENYTFEVLDNNIGLISYNSCQGHKAFKSFLKKAFREIEKNGIDKLVIDIRENGGGNSDLNDELLGYLTRTPYQQSSARYWKVSRMSKAVYSSNPVYPQVFGKTFIEEYMNAAIDSIIYMGDEELFRPIDQGTLFTGKTCFLIGPNTFSSANFLADAVKTYGLSTLIGQATGEFTNDYGEQLSFRLPYSGCDVFVSSTYDIGANGNADVLSPVIPDITSEDPLMTAIEWLNSDN